MKRWSCETMTSHASLEKVGKYLLHNSSSGLPVRGALLEGTVHTLV